MNAPVAARAYRSFPLAARREILLTRIHAARDDTTKIGRHLANDLRATERSRIAIQSGWKIFKASAVAAGVIWSFNATSGGGRSRRLFTVAVSLLSTMRTLRRMGALLGPLAQLTRTPGNTQ